MKQLITASALTLLSALSGACPTGNIDFVGFGTTANCAEGSAPTPAPSNTLAVLRADSGCTDSNNNTADFTAAAPASTRNSTTWIVKPIAWRCAGSPPIR